MIFRVREWFPLSINGCVQPEIFLNAISSTYILPSEGLTFGNIIKCTVE